MYASLFQFASVAENEDVRDDNGLIVLIKGYRADDSYFAFARAFLNNTITVEQLEMAMKLGELGELGEQWAVKSRRAFSLLRFRYYEIVPGDIYYERRKARDEKAREDYRLLLEKTVSGKYLSDLIREDGRDD